MAVQTATTLTPNDSKILSAIFDPETLPSSYSSSSQSSYIDTSLPPLPNLTQHEFEALEGAERAAIRPLFSENKCEIHAIHRAIVDLDWIIEQNPPYPSAYTNRAMARRLRCESNGQALFLPENKDEVDKILEDLSMAVRLAGANGTKVSPFQARVLRTAHSHRAYLYLKASSRSTPKGFVLPDCLAGRSKEQLEEMASRDFEVAARYGDKAAKEMSVRTNPYAKMCGAIVQGALREERREYEELMRPK